MSGVIPPDTGGPASGGPARRGVSVWVPVLAAIVALVAGGVLGAVIADDSSEGEKSRTAAALSIAAADVDYALAVQRLRSALAEYAATARVVRSRQQAVRAQAALARQEAQMRAVAAEARRQERQQRAQAQRRAADRLAALERRAQAASLAAQQRREAATTSAAAAGALQAYGQQLGAIGAKLDELLAKLAEAQTAAEVEAVMSEIADELDRLESSAQAPPASATETVE